MPTSVTFNGTAYNIPNAGELNWASLTSFLLDVGNNAQTTNSQKFAIRKATTSPVTVVAGTDCIIVTELAAPGAVTVNLPAGVAGQMFVIVDGTGDAKTNNITINRAGADTINGGTSYVLAEDRAAVILGFEDTDSDWSVLGSYAGDLTASEAVVTDANGRLTTQAGVSATEVGYLSGVTSDIQTQIDGKASTELDNLGSTAINADLDPSANNARDLGNDAAEYKDVYTHGLKHGDTTNPNLDIQTTSDNGDIALSPHGTGKVTSTKEISVTSTDAVKIPSGTTAQRPGTPAAGHIRLNSDSNEFEGYDGAAWGALGGGSAGINYVKNSDAEASANNDTSDGTAIAITAETTNELRGTQSFKVTTTGAVAAGAFVVWDMDNIDLVDKNTLMELSFDFADGSSYSAGDLEVIIRDTTNNADITPTQSAIPAGTGKFEALWVASDSSTYEVRVRAVTATTVYEKVIDRMTVGPVSRASGGVPVQEWTSWTPTYKNDAGTSASASWAMWKRVGQDMYASGVINIGGTGSSPSGFTVDLPTGYTLDASIMASQMHTGEATFYDSSGTEIYQITPRVDNTDGIFFYWAADQTGNTLLQGDHLDSGDIIWFTAGPFPIAEWAAETVSMANSRVEYAYNDGGATAAGASDTTNFAYGPSGVAIGNIASTTANSQTLMRVRFQNAIQATDHIDIEVSTDNDTWAPAHSHADIQARIFQSTSRYGIGWDRVSGSNTDIDVVFGNKGRQSSNATYAGDGATWAGISSYMESSQILQPAWNWHWVGYCYAAGGC